MMSKIRADRWWHDETHRQELKARFSEREQIEELDSIQMETLKLAEDNWDTDYEDWLYENNMTYADIYGCDADIG